MADPPFALGTTPLKDCSGNLAARQTIQSLALAAGLAYCLGDSLSGTGKPIHLKMEDLERRTKEYLDDNYTSKRRLRCIWP